MYCLPLIRLFSIIDFLSSSLLRNALCSSNCFCKLLESPFMDPNPIDVSSVFFRMTHSVNSRVESNNAFQCSEFDSKRFLIAALRELR
uniref:Putative secreted protein n=1 Tax=Anopheles darlingi TaxID=43151 RepID=A0A2M4D8R7_ANODA